MGETLFPEYRGRHRRRTLTGGLDIAQQREELERLEIELRDLELSIEATEAVGRRGERPQRDPIGVLFVCNGNSGRSQIAEALLNRFGDPDFDYTRPAAAARWLAETFGFESPNGLPEGDDPLVDEKYGFPWIELHAGNASLIIEPLADPPVDHAHLTHVPWVFVDDLEAHLARAREGGATIVHEIESHGFTSYVALDLEGRRWRFARARPSQPR